MKKTILLILVVAIGSILFYGMRYLHTPLTAIDTKMVVYEETVKAKAFFIREENVYTSDRYGTVYNHYSEGSRVKSGALLATVYSGDVSSETMQELRTIDKKIDSVSKNSEYNTVYDVSSISAESIIDDYKHKIIDAGEVGNISSVSVYKEVINGIRSGKGNQTTENIVAELENQKAVVENRIGVAKSEIYSENSGIFTTVLDGLEHYLTPEVAANMSVSDFEAIRVNNSEAIGNMVNKGSSVCKIVNNHEWYVLVCVEAKEISEYDIGSRVKMRFSSIPGEEIECKILNKSAEENGKVTVLLVSNHYLEGAYSFRESEATIILKSYTGFKVPVYALKTKDNVKGIIGEKHNEQKFYPCDILYTDSKGDFVIIESSVEGETLEEIERIIVGEK